MRLKAFRHIHDLAMLTQNTERRGSLVSRVTSDVDTISMFVQFGGLMLLINIAQITLATVLMVVYSPLLGLVVWLCFVPLLFIIRRFQGIVGRAYTRVRERVGDMLGAISEAVVGAQAIRAYGVEDRTAERIDAAVEAHRKAAIGAQARSVVAFTSGQLVSGLTTAVVLVVGTILAARGSLTLGELLAFLFLVNLFTQPVQQATEILNEMQNAVAGWRRVIGIIDTPADVSDPGESGVTLPRGPITVQFNEVGFAYPGGEPVLHDIDLSIAPRSRVAIVGETGSGKSTLAKLLTRLMDSSSGQVLLDGVDLRTIRFSSLRSRVVLVPQEGFLFDGTLLDNIRFGRPEASEEDVRLTLTELGLDPWVATLPLGLATDVGQRGRVAVGGGAPARGARPRLPRRPRPARPRRGHVRGRPEHRGAHPASPRLADPRPHVHRHRAPALDRPGRRRGHRRRRRSHRRARSPHRARPPRRRLLEAARVLGGPAAGGLRSPRQNVRVTDASDPIPDPTALDPQIAGLLKRDEHGLVAAVVQQHDTGDVLMVGWMDDEALRRTLGEGRVTFWSRSRQEYWRKGDTSGHVQWVKGGAPRLRRGRAARLGRPGRRGLPHRRPHLLRRARPPRHRRGARPRPRPTPSSS